MGAGFALIVLTQLVEVVPLDIEVLQEKTSLNAADKGDFRQIKFDVAVGRFEKRVEMRPHGLAQIAQGAAEVLVAAVVSTVPPQRVLQCAAGASPKGCGGQKTHERAEFSTTYFNVVHRFNTDNTGAKKCYFQSRRHSKLPSET